MTAHTLLPFRDMVALVKQEGPGVLDQFTPAIDRLVDVVGYADLIGVKPSTLYRNRRRVRASGYPDVAEEDGLFGRSPVWHIRTIVTHEAGRPGRGANQYTRRLVATGA